MPTLYELFGLLLCHGHLVQQKMIPLLRGHAGDIQGAVKVGVLYDAEELLAVLRGLSRIRERLDKEYMVFEEGRMVQIMELLGVGCSLHETS